MKNIWLIIDHPWQLLMAISIKQLGPENFNYHLIISDHKYWKTIEEKSYKDNFKTVNFFHEPSKITKINEILPFIKKCLILKKEIKKNLPIKDGDVFVTLSYFKYVENILTSIFPKNKSIFLCRQDMYKAINKSFFEVYFSPKYKIPKSSWLHLLVIDRLLGLKKHQFQYWLKTKERMHDITYTKPIEKLYNKVFVFKSIYEKNLNNKEFFVPYIFLPKNELPNKKNKIVYLLSDYVVNENYYQKINKILQTLKNNFSNTHELIIRLHPNKLDEYLLVDHAGWKIDTEPGNVEQYFLKHYSEIDLAVSHLSFGTVFSANIGIPSYSYFRCFNFNPNYAEYFEEIFKGLPKEFFMDSLTAVPRPYDMKRASNEEIKNSLNKIYNEF